MARMGKLGKKKTERNQQDTSNVDFAQSTKLNASPAIVVGYGQTASSRARRHGALEYVEFET
jgi:hypothetical protein